MAKTKRHVGEILVERGVITKEQLREALERQQSRGGKLGQLLVRMAFATEEEIGKALSEQMEIPHVNLTQGDIDPEAATMIPKDVALKYNLIPIKKDDVQVIVAMDDPLNSIALDVVTFTAGLSVVPVIASRSRIKKAIETFYSSRKLSADKITRFRPGNIKYFEEQDFTEQKLRYESKSALTIKSVDIILTEAIKKCATDIHIELDGNTCRVRYRIDGVLRESFVFPSKQHLGIVTRLKLLADLDITERQRPQRGGFRMEYEGQPVDLRISILPMVRSENAVIRVLIQDVDKFDLSTLGFSKENLNMLLKNLGRTSGVIFITGPTGNGKATTFYSIIRELSNMTRKIITLEDPVEYRFPLINQMTPRASVGMSHYQALKAIMRNDPDILAIKEVPDKKTAELCIRAGLAGLLVIAIISAKDACDCPSWLMGLGVERFLLASSIDLVIGQRLVRRLCNRCRKKSNINIGGRQVDCFKPHGCSECDDGYSGRAGLYEVIPGDIFTQEILHGDATPDRIREIIIEQGYRTLWEEGIMLMHNGVTSSQELKRALPIDYSKHVLYNEDEKDVELEL